jgi:hypothetical protein
VKLIYRIGGNNKDSLGVVEAEFNEEEVRDTEAINKTIEALKQLYFKHRVPASLDPLNIKKELMR